MVAEKGYYDLKDKAKPLKRLIDLGFVFAMCPPGAGRPKVSAKVASRSVLLSIAEFDE